MNLPLPVSALISVGEGANGTGYEVFLNRSGINSIDVPREKIQAEIGNNLRLRFLNRGAPIHITITSPNAGMYTDFFHENVYLVDEAVLIIPIRKDSQEGFFDLEILSGYGAMKTAIHVEVVHAERQGPVVQDDVSLHPVAHGRPHLLMVMMGIALVLFTAWLYTNIEFLNMAAFIILIVGALYIWYRQR